MDRKEAINQYVLLHSKNNNYGGGNPERNTPIIKKYLLPQCRRILDYGCGKGRLVQNLAGKYDIAGYDPGVPKFQKMPEITFDAVVCFDVLEHWVEPIDEDLKLMASKATTQIILGISCRPASAILPNGLNAHTLVMMPHQWYRILATRLADWEINATETRNRFFIVSLLKK